LAQSTHSNANAHRKLFTTGIDQTVNQNDLLMMNNGGIDVTGGYHQHQHHHHHHHHHQMLNQHANLIQQQDLIEASRTTPPDLSNIAHLKRSDSYFMSDELRTEILRKNLIMLSIPTQEPAIRMLIIILYLVLNISF
jgi:hypothetical protein